MAKADVVAAQKAAVLAGQDAALEAGLEAAYDGGAADQKESDGSFTQADIDAAVAAKGVSDQAAVDALTAQVSALQADDDAKTKIIAGIQALLLPPVQP
jgi:hypothetical protein